MGAESLPWAIVLFAIGLVALVKGGDWFVDGAVGIAAKFKIPEPLIGATVVSIGTTLPEVMVSATSAVEGLGAMSYGNAIGSIICNTSLIAGLVVAVKPTRQERKPLIMPTCFFFCAAIFYMIISYFVGYFSRPVGIVLLAGFVCYIIIGVKDAMKAKKSAAGDSAEEVNTSTQMLIIKLIVGAAAIAVGARLLVDNGTILAVYMGVPTSVVALTFIALGTSLPELATAIISLVKGHGALSLGNIVGANLFNLVLVNGVSVTLSPYDLPAEKMIFGMNEALVLDLPLMMLVMLLLLVPVLVRQKLSRWQGVILLGIYFSFCVVQFTV